MESVNYEYFDSENDYSKNPNATKHRSFNVSRGDFSKYAILNGFYGKKTDFSRCKKILFINV